MSLSRIRCSHRTFESLEQRCLLTRLVDLDGDADFDAIRGGYWFENRTGDGDFQLRSFGDAAISDKTIAADVDGDGDPDLISADGFWFENDGAAHFSARSLPTAAGFTVDRIQATDVGQDGKMDLLFFDLQHGSAILLRNTDGAGSFVVESTIASSGLIDVVDVDGDNDLDLLSFDEPGSFYLSWNEPQGFRKERILQNQANANDVSRISYFQLAFAQMDQDKIWDIVYTEAHRDQGNFTEDYRYWQSVGNVSTRTMIQSGCGRDTNGDYGKFGLSDWDNDGDTDSWCTPTPHYGRDFHAAENAGNGSFADRLTTWPQYGTGVFDDRFTDAGDINGDGVVDYVTEGSGAKLPVWIDGVTGQFYQRPESAIFADEPIRFGESKAHSDVVVNDVDADSFPEVIVASNSDISFWKIIPGDTFEVSPWQSIELPGVRSIQFADIDADGDSDLGVATTQGNYVFLNDGTGLFDDTGQVLGVGLTSDLAFGDVDSDGDVDLFFAELNEHPNQIWLNDGTGLFVDSHLRLGARSSASVALGDIDRDGDLDAVVGNLASPNQIWINRGDGWLNREIGDSLDSNHVVVADVNGDHQIEILQVNSNQGGPASDFMGQWRLGEIGIGSGGAFGDLDNDGDFDAVIANLNQPHVVWINQDHDRFGWNRTADKLETDASFAVALADLDLDGDLDAVFANDGQNAVYLNRSDPAFPSDVPLLPPPPVPAMDDHGNQNSTATAIETPTSNGAVNVTGRIDTVGDVDVFRLLLDENQRYQISMDQGEFRVYDQDGVWVRTESLFYAGNFATSELYVRVYGNVGDSYNLSVRLENNDHGNIRDDATPISNLPQTFEGEIVTADDVDFFLLTPEMGERYQFLLDSRTTGIELSAQLDFGTGKPILPLGQIGPSRWLLEHTFTSGNTNFNSAIYLEIGGSSLSQTSGGRYRLFVQRLDEHAVVPPEPIDPNFELNIPGDANRDGIFNSADFVQVFQAGQFEDDVRGNSTWETGDWNADGEFDTQDFVVAFQFGAYQE